VIVDRFHVAKNYRGCADKARKQEMYALKKTLSDEKYAELKGVMWAFRKRWADLTEEQQIPLLMLPPSSASHYIQSSHDLYF
jgi:transposase